MLSLTEMQLLDSVLLPCAVCTSECHPNRWRCRQHHCSSEVRCYLTINVQYCWCIQFITLIAFHLRAAALFRIHTKTRGSLRRATITLPRYSDNNNKQIKKGTCQQYFWRLFTECRWNVTKSNRQIHFINKCLTDDLDTWLAV